MGAMIRVVAAFGLAFALLACSGDSTAPTALDLRPSQATTLVGYWTDGGQQVAITSATGGELAGCAFFARSGSSAHISVWQLRGTYWDSRLTLRSWGEVAFPTPWSLVGRLLTSGQIMATMHDGSTVTLTRESTDPQAGPAACG